MNKLIKLITFTMMNWFLVNECISDWNTIFNGSFLEYVAYWIHFHVYLKTTLDKKQTTEYVKSIRNFTTPSCSTGTTPLGVATPNLKTSNLSHNTWLSANPFKSAFLIHKPLNMPAKHLWDLMIILKVIARKRNDNTASTES